MNRKTLLNKILFRSEFDKDKTEAIFNFIFECISDKLKEHESVTIEDLGKFEVKHSGIKRAIDKKQNREYLVPPKDKIKFTPSDLLISKINDRK